MAENNRERETGGMPFGLVGKDEAGDGEFPVLRAFQKYIDQEQAKSRRRMYALSLFFCALIAVLAVGFAAAYVRTASKGGAGDPGYISREEAQMQTKIALLEAQIAAGGAAAATKQTAAPTAAETELRMKIAALEEQKRQADRQADAREREQMAAVMKETVEALAALKNTPTAQPAPVAAAPAQTEPANPPSDFADARPPAPARADAATQTAYIDRYYKERERSKDLEKSNKEKEIEIYHLKRKLKEKEKEAAATPATPRRTVAVPVAPEPAVRTERTLPAAKPEQTARPVAVQQAPKAPPKPAAAKPAAAQPAPKPQPKPIDMRLPPV